MANSIAQVCSSYHPHPGGMEAHVKGLSETLARQGLSVDVLTTEPSKELPRKEVVNGVRVTRFACWAPGNAYHFSPRLRRYLSEGSQQYDVVHAHNYHSLPALYAALAKADTKLVFTPHYHGTSHKRGRRLLHVPYRFVWRHLARKVDRVICVTEAERQFFSSRFPLPSGRFVVIPNAVHIEAIRDAEPFHVGRRVVLCVGRLDEYKNVHRVVEAMPHLGAEYTLHIIGDGPFRSRVERQIIALNLQERVTISTGLDDQEVRRWYATCTAYVTLSSIEAFGITVLEALAAGRPVVASDIPAHRELAEKLQGIRLIDVTAPTPKEVGSAIAQAAEAGAPCNDLNDYSWDCVAQSVRRVYESATGVSR